MNSLALWSAVIAALGAEEPRISYGPPHQVCELEDASINESSGLAASRHPGCFWTHNDSGDAARMFLIDTQGHTRGIVRLPEVMAFDWEDMAAFEHEGKRYLLTADTGNNNRSAAVQMLHVIEEPGLDAQGHVTPQDVQVVRTIYFSYEDEHRDCEAVGVDPTDRSILLVDKGYTLQAFVYRLPWPQGNAVRVKQALVARKIGSLQIPPVTAMDISPDGRRAVVLTYANAYEFRRQPGEPWDKAFARPPREILMPLRRQGEAICYGLDGKTLYLTSEKRPAPLWEVPVVAPGAGH